MCLGVPGKVVEVHGLLATVDFWGVRKQIRLEVVDEPVEPGDYILNHVGYAIRRIPPGEIDATLALYEELLKAAEREDDLMAADIKSEIEGGSNDR
jgi:hydrogenase expression/formation protein HypC